MQPDMEIPLKYCWDWEVSGSYFKVKIPYDPSALVFVTGRATQYVFVADEASFFTELEEVTHNYLSPEGPYTELGGRILGHADEPLRVSACPGD